MFSSLEAPGTVHCSTEITSDKHFAADVCLLPGLVSVLWSVNAINCTASQVTIFVGCLHEKFSKRHHGHANDQEIRLSDSNYLFFKANKDTAAFGTLAMP